MRILEGQCQCGAFRYRVTGEILTLFVCHCSECQRQSASAFGMALWVRLGAVERFGERLREWVRATPSGRQLICEFCGNCGSRVFHRSAGQTQQISIKPGTLDDTSWLHPTSHIWTRRAQPWIALPSDCLLHEENPPDMWSHTADWIRSPTP